MTQACGSFPISCRNQPQLQVDISASVRCGMWQRPSTPARRARLSVVGRFQADTSVALRTCSAAARVHPSRTPPPTAYTAALTASAHHAHCLRRGQRCLWCAAPPFPRLRGTTAVRRTHPALRRTRVVSRIPPSRAPTRARGSAPPASLTQRDVSRRADAGCARWNVLLRTTNTQSQTATGAVCVTRRRTSRTPTHLCRSTRSCRWRGWLASDVC
jgi:hypothetical protein